MNQPFETIEYKGFKIKIYPDECVDESPREWDNLGKMVCWHRRYELGDEQPKIPPANYILFEVLNRENKDDYPDITDEQIWKEFDKIAIWLPLYLYDHSGITMNTRGFSCPWDSGQVGFIYVLKKDVLKKWNKKNWSNKLEKIIYESLKGEVKVYDQYLTGDVWGYVIDDIEDSCWGFYGYDYCVQEAKSMVDYWAKEAEKDSWQVTNLITGMED